MCPMCTRVSSAFNLPKDSNNNCWIIIENRNLQCHYSNKAKIGKPRGSMNKKTIERLQQSKLAKERNRTAPTPPSTACGDTRSTSPRAPTTSPPNRARDPTFNIAQSPPNTIETLDTPSFPSFTFGFSSSEALTMPGDEPDRIDWLPVMADNFMQHVGHNYHGLT
jgi:hypothetical protein